MGRHGGLFAGALDHGLKVIDGLSDEQISTVSFAVGDVVIVDGVAPGRVRGVHPSSAEVSVRLDEDNNLHRLSVGRVELYTGIANALG